MAEHSEFLAAVYEQPDHDAPRLVYADWLEEHGDLARAELIRLQCKMARGDAFTMEEEDRAFDLVEKHRAAWTAHLPQADGATWEFHRGFPEELAIAVGLLLDQWSVWAVAPRVRMLTLYDTTAFYLRAFATMPWNEAWAVLRVQPEPKPWLHEQPIEMTSGVRAVVTSPQARRLRELQFDDFSLDDGGITALCDSPHLDGLNVLGVAAAYADDARLVARFGNRLRRNRPW